MYSRVRHSFTLVELAVVIGIIVMTATLAVSSLRTESSARLLKRSALEFETFCARVRWQAMEQGSDRVVAWHPGEKIFAMERTESESGVETEDPLPSLKWKLPDSFEIDAPAEDALTTMPDGVEIFRFFPDGGASGKRKLVLRTGNQSVSLEISLLTGTLEIREGEEEAGI